jgi:hypothetical protein
MTTDSDFIPPKLLYSKEKIDQYIDYFHKEVCHDKDKFFADLSKQGVVFYDEDDLYEYDSAKCYDYIKKNFYERTGIEISSNNKNINDVILAAFINHDIERVIENLEEITYCFVLKYIKENRVQIEVETSISKPYLKRFKFSYFGIGDD